MRGIAYRPTVPSAQVKSAVLLAGLRAEGRTSVTDRRRRATITVAALRTFGFDVEVSDLTGLGSWRTARHRAHLTVPG
jgi:3-phosphoshikimate 1-carboxyvinyltransferase